MCDEFTDTDADAALARRGLTRRQFAALAPMATLAACGGGGAARSADLAERAVSLQMGGPIADGFFVHPAKGHHPGIVMWPDIAGLREAFRVMARRLAAQGFAVLVPNQYYRSSPAPVLDSFAQWRTPEGQARLAPMIAGITPAATMFDAKAFVRFLDHDEAVDPARGLGSCGYCMGGPFAVRAAAAAPARVRAVASLHGAELVGADPQSPVNLIAATRASYLFAIGRNDDARAPDAKSALATAASRAGRPAEIDVYRADHGWCVPDTPSYDHDEAERAWRRMSALFATL